jgi:hypothetical protein
MMIVRVKIARFIVFFPACGHCIVEIDFQDMHYLYLLRVIIKKKNRLAKQTMKHPVKYDPSATNPLPVLPRYSLQQPHGCRSRIASITSSTAKTSNLSIQGRQEAAERLDQKTLGEAARDMLVHVVLHLTME